MICTENNLTAFSSGVVGPFRTPRTKRRRKNRRKLYRLIARERPAWLNWRYASDSVFYRVLVPAPPEPEATSPDPE